ncbi:MAG: hypothetical protein KIG96_06520 [Treponema sp.]|nr:hypothetical protein [Treponema sp.]MDD7768045.1 hypothetical protein [Treponema sp.]
MSSWWALLCFVPYSILIAVRIKNEEKSLKKDFLATQNTNEKSAGRFYLLCGKKNK